MQLDILCFCHLRWNFVYQRPQHLLSRFSANQRVFVIEDPVFDAPDDFNDISRDAATGVWVVTPHIKIGTEEENLVLTQKFLLDKLMLSMKVDHYMLWYYSPMALSFSNHLTPDLILYDCMDELSAFKFAPPALKKYERALFSKADIVFTGGHNLYKAKKDQHHNIHPFPSSIDKQHFFKARGMSVDMDDQKNIPHPRLGFYGVIDERFNISLLEEMATLRPEWQFVLLGPVVKIDPESLPRRNNIHYLGGKDYKVLPEYLAGWDIAIMPFALNESTKYISPTKTPEFLAGGKPVISTSIVDVIVPYGEKYLVHIADTAQEFIEAAEVIFAENDRSQWLGRVDSFLADISWDKTWQKMNVLLEDTLKSKQSLQQTKKREVYV